MERKSKLSLSLTLTITTMLILAFAAAVYAPPVPIGDPAYTQAESFDSNPTTGSYVGIGTMSAGFPTNVLDGDFGTSVNWMYGGGTDGVVGNVEVSDFKSPADNGLNNFAITWLDIKIHYRATSTAANDDEYRIVAFVSGTPVVLADWVTGNNASYPPGINQYPAVRTFSNVAEPNDGVWTWTDVANLMVAFECLRVGANGFMRVYLYEVWATAYSTPYPAPGTMSVQPPVVWYPPAELFYVDIYVTDVSQFWGYEFIMTFDPAVLMPLEYMSYSPFISALPSEIGPDYIAVAAKTYDGDPTGFTGNTPVCRIWFVPIDGGAGGCPLALTKHNGADIYGNAIEFIGVNGYYNQAPPVPEFPLGLGIVMLLIPALPAVYLWRIRKKERD